MKNIAITVDDGLYRLARIKAAEQSTSLFQRLQREEQELRAELRHRQFSLSSKYHLNREKLHDRHALR